MTLFGCFLCYGVSARDLVVLMVCVGCDFIWLTISCLIVFSCCCLGLLFTNYWWLV